MGHPKAIDALAKDDLHLLALTMFSCCLRTCWFSQASLEGSPSKVHEAGAHDHAAHVPRTTLLALERTIAERKEAMLAKSGMLS